MSATPLLDLMPDERRRFALAEPVYHRTQRIDLTVEEFCAIVALVEEQTIQRCADAALNPARVRALPRLYAPSPTQEGT